MIFQTLSDAASGSEKAFRSVRNSTTGTSTVTIAAGTPLVVETNTGSTGGGFVTQALSSTAIINNLFVGIADAALPPDSVRLAQVYGVVSAVVVATAGASVGAQLIPNIATMITVGARADGNAGFQGAGGKVTVLVALSGATDTAAVLFSSTL